MGDFDRNEKPVEGSQTKKMIMVGVLGAVLLGVLGMQMVKRGPSEAAAAPVGGDSGTGAAPGADERPELLRAALVVDPTQKLLIAERSPANAASLRNPFGMSPSWRRTITREQTPLQQAQPDVTPVHTPDVPVVQPTHVPAIVLKATDYKLDMIFSQSGTFSALINKKILSAGQSINDAVVVEVRENSVILRPRDNANGRPLELRLQN